MIEIDDSELLKLIEDTSTADRGVAIYARQVMRATSLALEKRIKTEMPVDTGRARASWGHGGREPGDSIWREEDGGLVIEQGSNVPYIIYLNAGHSQQAPAGFIDRAALLAELELMRELGLVDPLSPDYQIARNNAGALRDDVA